MPQARRTGLCPPGTLPPPLRHPGGGRDGGRSGVVGVGTAGRVRLAQEEHRAGGEYRDAGRVDRRGTDEETKNRPGGTTLRAACWSVLFSGRLPKEDARRRSCWV